MPLPATLTAVRRPRIKIPATEEDAFYHCISRTVNGEWLFDDVAKEVLRRQLWQIADYCGLQILTYTILSNHFHILVCVPRQEPLTDAELLRRYRRLYPNPTTYQVARLEVIESELVSNGPEAVEWRRRQIALMGDVSQYMKLLKQRFSIWFNKTHRRFGTLWSERFKSVLVEGEGNALQSMAAYIDLNSVRAGLVTDPKDYRFCGYAEAVAGGEAARDGICQVFGGGTWSTLHPTYREILFGIGAGVRDTAVITAADFQRVIEEGGQLPLATVLRCRIRYFTDGAILGSRAFVEGKLAKHCAVHQSAVHTPSRGIPLCTEWSELMTIGGFRRRAIS